MKKFMKEITLFIIQLLIFYLFPLFAKQIDAIGWFSSLSLRHLYYLL